jgi:hypothetical protein
MTTSQKTINLVVHVEGGLVQAVYTDSPLNIRVAIQDFDVEGADLDELATLSNGTEFLGHIEQAITNNHRVEEVFAAFDQPVECDHKTDVQQENYLRTRGKFCPNCCSMNIESHGSMEADGDLVWSHVICSDCSSTWQENYRLESFSDLDATALKVIKCDSEKGYWSNDGWVFDVASASKFPLAAVLATNLPLSSGNDAEFIDLADAQDYLSTELSVGDEVFWNDPDHGISSGIYKIQAICTESGNLLHPNDVCFLKNDADSEAEVFAHELS